MKMCKLALIAALLSCLCALPTIAQCVEIAGSQLYSKSTLAAKAAADKALLKANAKGDAFNADDYAKILALEAKSNPAPDYAQVTLAPNTSIKLLVDNDVDSGFTKSDDYIQFSVAQDVFGKSMDKKENCVVIARGTKVFGVVDHSKAQGRPFRIGGKAVLYVYVDRVAMVNGEKMPIMFSEPEGVRDSISRQRGHHMITECKYEPNQKCIVGRRSKKEFNPALISAGASGLITFQDEKTANSVAGLTLLQGLGNATGVSDLVNQSNAALKPLQVFEARTGGFAKLWVVRAKADAPAAK